MAATAKRSPSTTRARRRVASEAPEPENPDTPKQVPNIDTPSSKTNRAANTPSENGARTSPGTPTLASLFLNEKYYKSWCWLVVVSWLYLRVIPGWGVLLASVWPVWSQLVYLRNLSIHIYRSLTQKIVNCRLILADVVPALVSIWLIWAILHSTFNLVLLDDYIDLELTRVGSIASSECKIWVRYTPWSSSDQASNLENSTLSLQVYFRPQPDSRSDWIGGPSVLLSANSDWTGHVIVGSLQPKTSYEYAWVHRVGSLINILPFSRTGRRYTRLRNSTDISLYRDHFKFKTLPERSEPVKFRMGFGSCLKPNFPYGSGTPGLDLFSEQWLDFLLLLGDTIYVDLNINMGGTITNYRKLYREVFGQREMVDLATRVPILATVDDHEILNDWDRGVSYPYSSAKSAFDEYLGSVNPGSSSTFQYTMDYGDVAFFIMDSRTFRKSGPDSPTSKGYWFKEQWAFDDPRRTMLGEKQLGDLFCWLKTTNNTHTFKVIATSVPFSFNWMNADTWYGYQHERQKILDFIVNNRIPNVLFISGDRHQLAASEFLYGNLQSPNATKFKMPKHLGFPPIVEFSVSPINQFNIPVPFHSESSNLRSDGSVRFPHSQWVKDKQLMYMPAAGSVAGFLYFDTTGSYPGSNGDPVMVFCVYSLNQRSLTSNTSIKFPCDDGRVSGRKVRRPIYQYILRGVRTIEKLTKSSDNQIKAKKTRSWLDLLEVFN